MAATAPLWYQQGNWPLVGAIAVLVITNAVTLLAIYLKAGADLRQQIKLANQAFVHQQLSEFYDPLVAALALNRDVFLKAGPDTFPADPIRRDAAGTLWSTLKEKVIIPNNATIANLLTSKSHLIAKHDELAKYLPLFTHIRMYQAFIDQQNEIYSNFRFPVGIEAHVETVRSSLLTQLR